MQCSFATRSKNENIHMATTVFVFFYVIALYIMHIFAF